MPANLAVPTLRTLSLISTLFVCAPRADAQAQKLIHHDFTTHWYEVISVPSGITWAEANRAAFNRGGYLASITAKAENDFVFSLVDQASLWSRAPNGMWNGPWIGAVQKSGSSEPAGGWEWTQLEAPVYTAWTTGQPDNNALADRAHFGGATSGRVATWADSNGSETRLGYVVEYSGPHSPYTLGLLRDDPGTAPGYTLFNPLLNKNTHLIDSRGRIVRTWKSDYPPGSSLYLTPRGTLLRCGQLGNTTFAGFGGDGGIVEEFDWDGKLVWSYRLSDTTQCLHHDIEMLPNGNILMIAWDLKTRAEAIANGRNPALIPGGSVWPDKIIEVQPTGTSGGRIVWEWNAWDHLVQDFDNTKANFGNPATSPQLIDINYVIRGGVADWLHANSIAYNAALDQIVISVRSLNEIWIIDHSTTTAEAAGHTGGRSGKGGDLLYRWGNPATYRAGTASDRKLFFQHDAHWIPTGFAGAGRILLYNNGEGRSDGDYSSIDELVLPTPDSKGNYPRTGSTWGPAGPAWTYVATPKTDMYSRFVSGAQRLPNGNTLIGSGWEGESIEVTRSGTEVWRYRNPESTLPATTQGDEVVGNMFFRSPRYFANGPELRGKDLTPGKPLENYTVALLADGSRLPHRAALNQTVELSVIAKPHPNKIYMVATAFTPGVLPFDFRFFPTFIDLLWVASVSNEAPGVFQNYVGFLDQNGLATAKFTLPNIPRLVGTKFLTAFTVIDLTVRSGIQDISNRVEIRATQ